MRRTALTLVSTLAALGVVALSAAPAMALKVHGFSTDFGAASNPSPSPANPYPLGSPTDVAVDNSAGASAHDVYVTDPTSHRVEKFDSTGHFLLMFGKGVDQTSSGNVCTAASGDTCGAGASGSSAGEFQTPMFVFVDSASGDVYVGDTSDSRVSKFDEGGNLIASWGTGGQLTGLSSMAGIAVDPSGNLFVLTEQTMHWFNPDGTSHSPPFSAPRGTMANGIAVDAEDNLYKIDGSPEVTKFTDTGGELGDIEAPRSDAVGLTIDPASNDLYVVQSGEGGLVNHFALNCGVHCATLDSFGSANLSTPLGISLDATSGTAYVANSGAGNVAVFLQGNSPEVTTGSASNITFTTATISGTVDPAGAGNATSCEFEYGTEVSYGNTSPCLDAGGAIVGTAGSPITVPTAVHADISGLSSDAQYHFRLAAANSVATGHGQDQIFESAKAVADLSTEPAANVTGTAASLNGSFTGNGEETHYHFEWGTSTSYGNTTAAVTIAPSSGHTPVAPVDLTGLEPTTTYHFRVVATNGIGTSVGSDRTFETQTLPSLILLAATELTIESATLEDDVNPREAGNTTYHFEYGTDTNYGSSTPESSSIGSDNIYHAAPASLGDLETGTTYHYRIVATSPAGVTVGGDQSFTTFPFSPIVISAASSAVTPTTATLSAQINPRLGPTIARFEYGTSTLYGLHTFPTEPIGSDDTEHSASAEISALMPGSTYHFRVVAINFAGTTYGSDLTFTTPNVPAVAGSAVSAVTQTTAVVRASIRPGFVPTTYRVEYGLTGQYGSSTAESPVGSDNAVHPVSGEIAGLSPASTYHLRVVATNAIGATAGPDQTFTTAAAVPQTPPPLTCRRGFVKKHGKCVKKVKRKRHQRRSHR